MNDAINSNQLAVFAGTILENHHVIWTFVKGQSNISAI